MNKIFKKVWNASRGAYVVVAETTSSHGKTAGVVGAVLSASLLAVPAKAAPIAADTLPSGGQVAAGAATISGAGTTLTVNQSSQRAAINWQSFSIGSNATVNFVQPNASSVTLNRVVGNEQSLIAGAMNANGQVFLLNSSGVLFTGTSSVNVGGLVASTLNISNADFMAGSNTFTSTGRAGSVINLGTLHAADGGYVALLGNQVSNQGTITARMGTAVLAAGDRVSLNFNGNSLVGVTIDQGTLNALVENKNAIVADGGLVVLTAKGADTVLSSLVNNTGQIRARTVANRSGKIYLLGDMETGTVGVNGTLDASAPDTGDGGFVETSAAHVKVAETTSVTTRSATGQNGLWLIDPNDFTIASSGGDMSGAAVSAALAGGNLTIQSASGSTSGNGDIFVRDNVTWTSGNTLTLEAYRNIRILATVDASGGNGGVVTLKYGQGAIAANNTATYDFGLGSNGFAGKLNLKAGQNFNTLLGSDGVATNWTVITALGAQGDQTTNPGNSLQGLSNPLNRFGNWVLGGDIDASATASWNSGAGFVPIGNASASTDAFAGKFDGLGHQIQGLVINRGSSSDVGLFANTRGNGTLIQNLGLTKLGSVGRIQARSGSGALVGRAAVSGTLSIRNVYSTLDVAVTNDKVGGLVGYGSTNKVSISSSYSTGQVSGRNDVGGLLGYLDYEDHVIQDSYATGNVQGTGSYVGGLVGEMYGSVINSYATGSVSTNGDSVGGLVGLQYSYGPSSGIFTSYATGLVSVSGVNQRIGGLVGQIEGTVSQSYATGNVQATGSSRVGGLIGYSRSTRSTINSYATGAVSGNDQVGGLIGLNENRNITNSYSAGQVTGNTNVGGLVGAHLWSGVTTNSYWDTQTSGQALSALGVGKTTAEMRDLFLFGTQSTPAWDIVSDNTLPVRYPYLRWSVPGASAGSSVWVIGTGQAVTYTVPNANQAAGTPANLPSPVYTGGSPTGTSTVRVYDSTGRDVTSLAAAGTLGVGSYTLSATLNDGTYALALSGNTNGVLTLTAPSSGGGNSGTASVDRLVPIIGNIANVHREVVPPVFAAGVPPSGGEAATPPPNVVNAPASVTAVLGDQIPLLLVTAPDEDEPTQAVTLSQAQQMLSLAGAAESGPQVVRVPTSRNSLENIVNGGLRLPSGVEQQLFVVQASAIN